MSENSVSEICGFEKVMVLLRNIKIADNIEHVYIAIQSLTQNIKMYKLYYCDNDWAVNRIKRLVNET